MISGLNVLGNESDIVKISIDCMGGDHGVSVTVPASLAFLKQVNDVHLTLVGRKEAVEAELAKNGAVGHPRITIKDASDVVAMDAPLMTALRKRRSSMHMAILEVKTGEADACVSAGNTGALMAVSHYLLDTIPGVERPAICGIMPNAKDMPTYVLDLGANVDCEAEHLRQFALMGAALYTNVENRSPKVGLLNVGTEDIKGNEVVKKAGKLLQNEQLNGTLDFCGNVEGNDIFAGTCDIVVCDGFTGNVMLKAVEGLGHFFRDVLVSQLKSSAMNMLGALLSRKALNAVRQKLNPSRYNGASMLGLRGLVFKSHGGADAYAYSFAIRRAYDAVKGNVLNKIYSAMSQLIKNSKGTDPSEKTENGKQDK